MATLKTALLQLTPFGLDGQAISLQKGEVACREAAARGADIALFPEMWNVGYSLVDPDDEAAVAHWAGRAISAESSYVLHFRSVARLLDMAIGLTYLEQWPGRPRNTLALIDRHGEIVLTYAKVHTCEFDRECTLTPGEDFPVVSLDTAHGPVRVGAMICYDREFPEAARILMLHGAEIILTPNACDIEINRLSQYRARSYENMVGLAMANYAAPRCNGQSVAFDGIAFDRFEASRDMTLVHADEAEGVFMAEFDLDALRDYRSRETWGNAYRRPRLYAALTDETVAAPFVRKDATR